MDYAALLRQKDAELEERAALLLKTKQAIEALQEELGNSRRAQEAQRKVGGGGPRPRAPSGAGPARASPQARRRTSAPMRSTPPYSHRPLPARQRRRQRPRRRSCATRSSTCGWWRASWRARRRSAPAC